MRGPRSREAAEVVEAHGDNIRQAWHHATSHRQWPMLAAATHALALYYRITASAQRALQLIDMSADRQAPDTMDHEGTGEILRLLADRTPKGVL